MKSFEFPDLPVSAHRREIVAALRAQQVVVVVGETGSGKTTQLPKMALMAAGERAGRVGCTQPRRLAAVAVARRLAEELGADGSMVGYHVRFDDRTDANTRIKLMTDGILLAETQKDPDLRAYHTIILDEAHERSLNIDFLLGYLKLLLKRRRDLRVIISSATMNAAAFSDFFGGAPVIEAQGRTYPVEMRYMPPMEEEELTDHVVRAVEWLTGYDAGGDVLVFLPGEREIRDCAEALEGRELTRTEILPLFARLSLADQQRIFHSKAGTRRIVLTTNVAETSLTIPGIMYVIDSGLARISRYLPGRQIQSLQVEAISQASARQRAGRCGRIAEGVCVRLYSEEDYNTRDAYTDPEIRRSALAGVILRMADLRLPPLGQFPLPDPPSERLIREGYKTLQEIGALDASKRLTAMGKQLARLPLDPRLGRILLEAKRENALAEALIIVAALSIQDPRERPAEHAEEADRAHAVWRDEQSDYLTLLQLWRAACKESRDGRKLRRNALRRWCAPRYLSFTRMLEWNNLEQDLRDTLALAFRWRAPELLPPEQQAPADSIHRAILAGAPLQIGVWNREERVYRSTAGRSFSIFPGSGLFRRKQRADWVFGTELTETGRLWLRRAAELNPAWVEQVAPHLCTCHAFDPQWDSRAGVVYAKERVVCGGLTIIESRRISYARYNPAEARAIMISDGIIPQKMQGKYPFLTHLAEMLERVSTVEAKLRRRDLIRSPGSIYRFFDSRIPAACTSEKALRTWLARALREKPHLLDIPYEQCIYPGEDDAPPELYPDELTYGTESYPVYYLHDPAAPDDGVTIGVHIDQLTDFPEHLPGWGIPAHSEQRVEILLRTLPKAIRQRILPISEAAQEFCDEHAGRAPQNDILRELGDYVHRRTGVFCHPEEFDPTRLPPELITKVWVCDDEGQELALGTDVQLLRTRLASYREKRFHTQAKRAYSSTPMTQWDCGVLPESVAVGDRLGYPALADEEQCVRLRICASPEQASFVHRAGVRRLAWLRCAEFLHAIRKRLPINDIQARLAISTLGAHPADNVRQSMYAAMDAGLAPLPRSPEEFEAACERMREKLSDTLAGPITRVWHLLALAHEELKRYRLTASTAATARTRADLERQWAWLTRPNFLCAAPPETLPDYTRFLRGLLDRLRRLATRPATDDLSRVDLFDTIVPAAFYDNYPAHADSVAWLQVAYMVAEFRLSIFAAALALKGRASPKVLRARLETLNF